MRDPWDEAADQRTHQNKERIERDAQQRQEEARKEAAKRKAQEAAYQKLEEAIRAATPKLAAFLRERGAAAQHLLGAYSDRAYIWLGGEEEGGSYFSVTLSAAGLRYEVGTKSGYSSTPTKNRAATPEEAVKHFAMHGPGRKDPAAVRDIVQWLTKEIDEYA